MFQTEVDAMIMVVWVFQNEMNTMMNAMLKMSKTNLKGFSERSFSFMYGTNCLELTAGRSQKLPLSPSV